MDTEYLEKLVTVIECKNDVVTFLHNTKEKETADRISRDGFEFQSHLDYTTDVVSAKDPITIKYFSIVRQAYGDYTIIMQISKQIIEDFSAPLVKKAHHFSEILTVKEPFIGPDDDIIYCLAPNFVKGYINVHSAEFVANPKFDSSLILPEFNTNLKKILDESEY
jgi:hypothetical protein